jgi:histidinol-phosphatase
VKKSKRKRGSRFPNLNVLYEFGLEAGDLMSRFGGLSQWDMQEGGVPVPIADQAINHLVIRRMKEEYPHISVISDREKRMVSGSEYSLLFDLEGKKSLNHTTFSMAVVKEGAPIAAIIFNPFNRALWMARKGQGCHMNGRIVRVSDREAFEDARCYSTWRSGEEFLEQLDIRSAPPPQDRLREFSAVYQGGLLASGLLECVAFPVSGSCKAAAAQLIVEESGGTFSDLHGEDIVHPCGEDGRYDGVGFLATNGVLHEAFVKHLASMLL